VTLLLFHIILFCCFVFLKNCDFYDGYFFLPELVVSIKHGYRELTVWQRLHAHRRLAQGWLAWRAQAAARRSDRHRKLLLTKRAVARLLHGAVYDAWRQWVCVSSHWSWLAMSAFFFLDIFFVFNFFFCFFTTCV
jgi:hypothetical protein